jgi:hypothetical protein
MFFKLVVVISIFTFSKLGVSEEITTNTSLINSADQIQLQKKKEDFDILLETWALTYEGEDGVKQQSIMTLTAYFSENGTEGLKGLFYRDEIGKGEAVACKKIKSEEVKDSLNGDYLCQVSDTKPIFQIGFKILDNAIIGIFSGGDNINEASNNLLQSNFSITGIREEIGYDDEKNELLLPVVKYKDTNYRVILEQKDDFIFVKEAQPTLRKMDGKEAVYDDKTLELVIPNVKYQGSSYKATFDDKGELKFLFKEGLPI